MKTVTLGEIAEFKNGLNFRANESGFPIKVLGVGDFQKFSRLDQVKNLTTIYTDKEINESYHLKNGDIVFVRSNGNKELVGRSLLVYTNGNDPVSFSGFTIRARLLTEEVKPEYVNLLMQAGLLKATLKREGAGTNISNLNQDILAKLPIQIISIDNQEKVLDYIASWDAVIETTERLIAAKEQYLSGLMQKFLHEPTWSDVQLKDILSEHGSKSNGLCGVHSVSVSKGIVNQIEHLGRSFSANDTSNYNLVKPFDIVYTKSPTGNFPYGIIKQNLLNYDVIVSPLYGVYSPKNRYLGFILHVYFESAIRTLNYLQPIVQKGAKNTISITNQTFLKNHVRVPLDEEEQKNVAEVLMTAKREIELLKKLAESYRIQKRGLMQKLLSGEWKVAA